ncbi:tocopherol cyclase family protein [Carboxylicivirga marina]|uniref:Tocopherol cyclase n=1 Tax=Carboxylicivirga marina TaxID=2800988 RepID=A0ABS1HLW5_9BACT|nr:tocopherol cyclase family protein [Carboxylicivirga marina]MBK3518648.1 hypothetical protein [Carboxylicivirga marina]
MIGIIELPSNMFIKKLKALFHPERYHGWGINRNYFEGWYYKVISADECHAFAFIPGIAMDKQGQKHAFVQVLDGKNCEANYFRFPADSFVPRSDSFDVLIDDNRFRSSELTLDLPGLKGHLQFENDVPWPSNWYSPGIMGPYAFIPFMECYHGIVSMDHCIKGALEIIGQLIDFTGGRGYIEKDWGRSFPSAYFWVQSNHFSKPGISLKASIANIPWLGSSFVGFIAGLYFNGQLIQFTTYNRTKLLRSYADKKVVELFMENKQYRLEIIAHRQDATELASPINGFMDGRISESMTSTVEIWLSNKNGSLLLHDIGRNVGLEVAGMVEQIIT